MKFSCCLVTTRFGDQYAIFVKNQHQIKPSLPVTIMDRLLDRRFISPLTGLQVARAIQNKEFKTNLMAIDDLLADLSQYVEHEEAESGLAPSYDAAESTLLTRIVEARRNLDVMLDD